jgi:ribonuclease BN (tRNA processing enzyme)
MKKVLAGFCILSTFVLTNAFAEDQLKATIIGSGSPIYDENRASASVLITAGETAILVDMGNGTQANLNKLGFDSRSLNALIFTHHHLDHNEEFVPLFIRSLMGRNSFSIIGPVDTKNLVDSNLSLYQKDISYRLEKSGRTLTDRKTAFNIKELKGGEKFNINDIQISTVAVPHTIETIAYRFDYKQQSIVITGDLTYSQKLPLLAKDADYMIIDSGGMVLSGQTNKHKKKAGSSNKTRAHLDLNDSSNMAAIAGVDNLVYTHFTPGIIDQTASLDIIRKNYTGNVIFSEDLMVVNQASDNTTNSSNQLTFPYAIVDTAQNLFYSDNAAIKTPNKASAFSGQDASYFNNQPSYTNNNDGTITDNVTGLTWQQNMGEKLTYEEAVNKVKSVTTGGHNDWRIPTLKELYSLIEFSGIVKGEKAVTPFIDTDYFNQPIGDVNNNDREIDAQTWSQTKYVGKTMNKDETIFGVNFVDGRIKGYPVYNPRTQEPNKMYFRLVRGNTLYGQNDFVDNGDNTITDKATGLTWQKSDSRQGMNWEEALNYAENSTLGKYDDWRLPNAKELQSIVDYSRSPQTTDSPAIDPVFQTSAIINEGGDRDYPYFWTSTTHLDGPNPGGAAVYIAFGEALGKMRGEMMDVHGAGAQRSDPKTGVPTSRGPQGDMIRVDNYVRLVRGGLVAQDITQIQQNNNEIDNIQRSFTPASNTINNTTINKTTNNKGTNNKVRVTNRFIARFDKNGNGVVSREEFTGPKQRFDHFDKNKDDVISSEEAPTGERKE